MPKFRVFCTANPLPVPPGVEDSAGDRYMLDELGFEPWAMMYHGSLNRIGVHVRADGSYIEDANQFTWERDVNRSDPAHAEHEWAVRQYAKLCAGSANRYKKHLPATLPIAMDLEYGPWSLDVWATADPAARLDAVMSNYLKVLGWIRQESGGVCPVGSYQLPVAYEGQLSQAVAQQLAYAMPTLYMLQEYLPNPNLWFDAVDRTAAALDRVMPWLPKVAFINPTWQIYTPGATQDRYNGKTITLELWKRQINHLLDTGWQGVYCWWGPTPLNDATKPYLRELNLLQR